MQENKTTNNNSTLGIKLIILIGIAIIAGIVLLKTLSNRPPVRPTVPSDSIAIPDLPVTPEDSSTSLSATESLRPVAVSDTVGIDPRPPFEAGYEDGYLSGLDDGRVHKEKATYDESSAFRREEDQKAYAAGYREGYAIGYKDGLNGNEFNMSPPNEEKN